MNNKRTLDLDTIMGRIKIATYDSQIAVFRSLDGLDAVFADTVMTRELMVESNDFIGSFHRGYDMDELIVQLRKAEREQHHRKRELS